MSVGVKAALIGGCAVIIAAFVGIILPIEHKESVANSANNSQGIIQAGRDVVIQHNNQPTNSQFDTTLIKSYDDKFEHMTRKRALAAIAIEEYLSKGKWNLVTNNTDGLDEVLSVFEIMGYDEQHGLINPKTVYEYFYEDIVAYYQSSADYIVMVQKSDGATTYANIKPLYETMIEIEMKEEHTNLAGIQWSKADFLDYFKSETNSVNLKEDK